MVSTTKVSIYLFSADYVDRQQQEQEQQEDELMYESHNPHGPVTLFGAQFLPFSFDHSRNVVLYWTEHKTRVLLILFCDKLIKLW